MTIPGSLGPALVLSLCWHCPHGIKHDPVWLHGREQGAIITAAVAPGSLLSRANGPAMRCTDPRWHRALPSGCLRALPCPRSLCLCATSSVHPWPPVPSSALAHPQLLLCPGDADGDRLVQRGRGLWGSWEGLSTARTPRKPPSTSREWGNAVTHPPRSKSLPASCQQRVRFAQGPASATAAAKRVLWWDLGTFLLGN